MKLLILLLTLSILLCSCASNKRWKSHHHTSRVRFDQDNAFCKMKSNETYNNSRGYQYASGGASVTNSSGYYDPATGTYSSSSKTKQEVDYIGNMADAVVRGSNADVAYKLCMQSKGYYQVENKKKKSNSYPSPRKQGLGKSCRRHIDCDSNLKCYENNCVTKSTWDKEIEQKRAGVENNNTSTLTQKLQKAAEQGDATAQFRLAGMYIKGTGVPKDSQKASELLQKASDQGHVKAQGALGGMYFSGQGVIRDYQKALKWLKAPAEKGFARAQSMVGRIYLQGGYGVSKDERKATKWLLKVAKNENFIKNFMAQGALSEIYYNSKDYKNAVKWFGESFRTMPQNMRGHVFTPTDKATLEEMISVYALLEILVLENNNNAVQYRDNIAQKFSIEEKRQAQVVVAEIQRDLVSLNSDSGKQRSKLTIISTPSDSKIRILNIKPKYSAKMTLAYGKYHVEISKDGYKTKRQWVTLKQNITDMSVVLQKNDTLPTIKNRLLVVQDLYRDGLMTEEEYHSKRKKIMSEL